MGKFHTKMNFRKMHRFYHKQFRSDKKTGNEANARKPNLTKHQICIQN